jgi:hypothetical protein
MSDKIEVQWRVADGYAGKDRPQSTRIAHSDILMCDSEEDVRQLVEDSILDDFEQRISADYGEAAYTDVLEFWREMREDAE